MAIDRGGPSWLVVDHELLARLGPTSTREEWVHGLRRTGLLELTPPSGPEGDALAELQGIVRTWREDTALDLRVRGPVGGLALGIGMGAGVLAGMLTGSPLVALVGIGATAWVVLVGLPRVSVGEWLRGPVSEPVVTRSAERATRALRRLLSRTFVQAAGEHVVENTPHRAYLQIRLEEIDVALRAADGRLAELAQVRERIRDANVRVGRAPDDVETARLDAAMTQQTGLRERVSAVRDLLAERLTDLDTHLERLRALAERRALSEQVSRLTEEGGARDPLGMVAAAVEIDVAEIEGRIDGLALEAGHADLRLRSLLEVVGATRRAS